MRWYQHLQCIVKSLGPLRHLEAETLYSPKHAHCALHAIRFKAARGTSVWNLSDAKALTTMVSERSINSIGDNVK
jgi:hypothetical protein